MPELNFHMACFLCFYPYKEELEVAWTDEGEAAHEQYAWVVLPGVSLMSIL